MATPSLKVGDVVRLTSGGPPMTVIAADNNESIGCTWFASTEQKYGNFPAAALQNVERR